MPILPCLARLNASLGTMDCPVLAVSIDHSFMDNSQLTKDNRPHRIGVIGSGSWATAMIKMLTDNENTKQIRWWIRNEEVAQQMRATGRNPNYLSAVTFDVPTCHIMTDVAEVVHQSDIIILNTPAAYLKDALLPLPTNAFDGKIVISAIKGIVPDENEIVGDYLQRHYNVPMGNIVIVGGPCHAEEVAQERLSYLTIASTEALNAETVAALLRTTYIKTIVSDDIYGTEYAAVLKNIYAVAGGICHGIGFGDNFQAVLVSNAIRELEYFVTRIHPIERNIMESAYLGDLLVTSYSQHSRNRTFGNMIGKGYRVKSAQLEMNMVAEGYYASSCIQEICRKHHINLPICDAVYNILYLNKSPREEMCELATKLN